MDSRTCVWREKGRAGWTRDDKDNAYAFSDATKIPKGSVCGKNYLGLIIGSVGKAGAPMAEVSRNREEVRFVVEVRRQEFSTRSLTASRYHGGFLDGSKYMYK